MNLLTRLKAWHFLRQNSYPCKPEIRECLAKHPNVGKRIVETAEVYCDSVTIEEAATKLGVTRERVRQILLKLRRAATNVDRNV